MIFSSLTPCTLQDYPGHLAMMVFTPGCNFRCGYCHNPEFVDPVQIKKMKDSFLDEEVVLSFLEKRQGLLAGVVICGGEPTIHRGLLDFIRKVKGMGFLVKLDTNGSHPEIIRQCFDEHLLDYVAMDLKYDPAFYEYIAKTNVYNHAVKMSIELIKQSTVLYEFRSTVLPSLHTISQIRNMGESIKGARTWVLQRFSPAVTLDVAFENEQTFMLGEMEQLVEVAKEYAQEVSLRF